MLPGRDRANAIGSDIVGNDDLGQALQALRDAVTALSGAIRSEGIADDRGFWMFTQDLHERAEQAWVRYSELRTGR